ILTVRSRKSADGSANGVEVFFSEPVDPATVTTSSFSLAQSDYSMGAPYGCNGTVCQRKVAQDTSVTLSADNRKAFVGIATQDSTIGASHFGTLCVGNNTTGLWGGPGHQDRTLRVTVDAAVRSAAGASLYYNIAYMGWLYQAETRFDPTNSDLNPVSIDAKAPVAKRIASAVSSRVLPGVFNVRVDLPGRVTASLYSADGALRAERSSNGTAHEFNFDTRTL